MGTNLTNEKLEKIKQNYQKNKIELKKEDKLLLSIDSNNKDENSNNLTITFKKLYHSKQDKKVKNLNNIDFSINTIKSEKKPQFKNNIESLEETREINYIIFRNHKSFEYKYPHQKEKNNNENFNKIVINTTSITLDTTEYSHKKRDPNSFPDGISDNSDYIDISQSIFFSNNNNIKISYNKTFYGKEKKIRESYYNALIIKNIWKPLIKEKKYNTIFFFDWDDTLMCTSYIIPFINSNNINIKTIKEKLKNLDENILNLLSKTLTRGIVFIITNAAPGWVEYSSTNFLPLTAKILNKIKIISAKGLYSKKYPGDPKQWKIKAFKYAIEKYKINTNLVSNIVSLGDSYIDLEAIESLRYVFTNAYIKIIKFKESPHPVELEKQIFIVISQLDYILKKVKNFTLKVSKKKKE